MRLLVPACLVLFAAACDSGQSASRSGPPPVLTNDQNELFQTTCALCHIAEDTNAPQLGDKRAWDDRWKKGFDVLFANTVNGTEGMPPLGTCAACTGEDLEIFIQYLAGRSFLLEEVN